jgi:DNA-binding transcriptional regulator YiaG
MSGWRYPFSQWVLDGWAEHSRATGGPEIAAAFRKNLSDPKGAYAAALAEHKRTQRSMTIAATLARIGWSKQTLAERLRVDERTVRRWATGATHPPERVVAWLDKLAALIDKHPPPERIT